MKKCDTDKQWAMEGTELKWAELAARLNATAERLGFVGASLTATKCSEKWGRDYKAMQKAFDLHARRVPTGSEWESEDKLNNVLEVEAAKKTFKQADIFMEVCFNHPKAGFGRTGAYRWHATTL